MHRAHRLILSDLPARRPLVVEDGPGVLDGGALNLAPGTTQGLGTYLNGFPAAYWARWTGATRARLTLDASGAGTVRLLRSDAEGRVTEVASGSLDEPLEADLSPDGGWLWCEVSAAAADGPGGSGGVVVAGGEWSVDVPPRRDGEVLLSITTMDKPEYCVATLATLAGSSELAAADVRVQVVDQGTRKVAEHPGFADVAAALGDRLRIVDQPNLGGSGGFSRGMLETLDAGADAVLICDDDVEVEPEALLRAVRFHRSATTPVIVGGHMLDLARPTVLNSFSEVIHRRTFNWGPPVLDRQWHDLAGGLRATPWLHARAESDFNGWWMCLIPAAALREVGLSMPLFLKWDDAEFSLRGGEAGFPTVSLPGACLWHMAWTEKDDSVEWQAYLHVRNRVITALVHARGAGLLPAALLATDLKLLLAMRYYPVDLHVRALREVLAGPGRLHPELGTVVGQVRAVGAEHPETVRHRPGDAAFDAVAGTTAAARPGARPSGALGLAAFVARGLLRTLRPVPAAARREPAAALARTDAGWWQVPAYDSVLVLDADATSGVWLRRDRRRFWRLAGAAVVGHAHLAWRWRSLARTWRAAAPDLVSTETWRADFAPGHAD
ncbi:galactofuranosylgalactofuranosylrhamnosyl-N-acetylglucosaminyl-diphospho-decaprenol beta-1,5/1,6-galactofuranosyltransferase [Isoptericola sp. CG 20/1183]|uniref:Galactofuranosylgalactofuranosylrhamnosyl-N-acetylglucosaminyl-diphospho-decaprenol beta-1,5/1,6-galactofuranosyltransferase n=1 Tax=Isoptericola halotolerans TaxID=300560 RepID=A0ABX5EDR2_9MICO|nr:MULTISPECIES: glycosyltransferase [Isoptericola]PRZ06540.1 galactofuranosylgalactofuranosylrhamnosyl-N-acetylglucosaminyl-diphospho-decaprenol beta-1,5/1,6-galactofuranosyltransferase [Isoptericola halotolerans]PRZ06654.1 galactofuranosylgalactofuranosylrhamnosyl-N-acetylglucosaminyl-diphospho-decaprenol beta-1,5/1,6-galactofuranosyltransferase [Isoptericola sp. CG 20/1183]